MTTYYCDFASGSDANNGSSWALAKKNISGFTTLVGGDIVRMAKTADPRDTGMNGTWVKDSTTSYVNSQNLSTTAFNPISVNTTSAHGLSTGDTLFYSGNVTTGGVGVSGPVTITVTSSNTYTINNTTATTTASTSLGGTSVWKLDRLSVKVDTPTWKFLDDCEYGWTAISGNAAISYVTTGPTPIHGRQIMRMTMTGTTSTGTTLIQKSIAAGNCSAYQQLGFYFGCSSVPTSGTILYVQLCSGASVVAQYGVSIPATTNTGNTHLGNTVLIDLGSAIASTSIDNVKIVNGDSLSASTFYFGNMVLFKAPSDNPVTHRSLVGTNDSKKVWYPVVGFTENNILLSGGSLSMSNTNVNHCEESGTYDLYAVEPYRPTAQTTTTAVYQNNARNGLSTNRILFEGGYNTATSTVDGMTIIDGSNLYGYCFNISADHQEYKNIGTTRFNRGFSFTNAENAYLSNCFSTANRDNVFNGNILSNVMKFNSLGPAGNNVFTDTGKSTVLEVDYSYASAGAFSLINDNAYIDFKNIYGSSTWSSGMTNAIVAFRTAYPAFNFSNTGGDVHIVDSSVGSIINSSRRGAWVTVSNTTQGGTYLAEGKFSDSVDIKWDSTFGESGAGWKYNITGAIRTAYYPSYNRVALAYVTSGSPVTATLRVKLSAGSCPFAFYVKGQGRDGLETSIIANADTSNTSTWQTLTLTWTPSTSGVVEFMGAAWLTSGSTGNVLVDNFDITQ